MTKDVETHLKEWTKKEMEDKVRVDEVQDALKKISDTFYVKINSVHESSQQLVNLKYQDNCQSIVGIKENLAKMLSQFSQDVESRRQIEQ